MHFIEGNEELWNVLERREGWYPIHILTGDQRCERVESEWLPQRWGA